MSSFEEFLQDYEAREREEAQKFIKRFEEGKVLQTETFPTKDRFVKLKEPIAHTLQGINVWGLIPFYGSTIVFLRPSDDEKAFDSYHKHLGFTSRDIDNLIELAKGTGRIQFTIDDPTRYKNLDFLEPLFHELKPPANMIPYKSLVGHETYKKYLIEFETLAQFGFTNYINSVNSYLLTLGIVNRTYTKDSWHYNSIIYIALKALGYKELADEIGSLMIINPPEALNYLTAFGDLIINPQYDMLKPIYIYKRDFLTEVHELVKQHRIDVHNPFQYEIGKFILNKLILYPETIDGCMRLIQEYKDHELYKVLCALDDGIKRKKIDIIEDKKVDMSEILDNVWKDADKIKLGSEGINFGVSLDIGLIGELASGLPGVGLMAGLGFQAIDRFWGVKSESISEKIAKFVSPNYLVAIYDFKKQHALPN